MANPIASDLSGLTALQKVALSWPFAGLPPSAVLSQFARITKSLPVSLEYTSDADLTVIGGVQTSTGMPICITSQAAYTSMRLAGEAASKWSSNFQTDLNAFGTRCAHVAGYLGGQFASQTTYFVIDQEFWHTASQNAVAMRNKYQVLVDVAKEYFPNAKLVYYDKGAILPNGSDATTGYAAADYYPADVADYLPGYNACSLYFSEHAVNQAIWIKSTASAKSPNYVPFLSLGACHRRLGSSWGPYGHPAMDDINIWNCGLEINNAFVTAQGRYPLITAPLAYLYHYTAPDLTATPSTTTFTTSHGGAAFAHNLGDGDPIWFETSGAFPRTTPQITSGTTYYVRVTGMTASTFKAYTSLANALADTSPIAVNASQAGASGSHLVNTNDWLWQLIVYAKGAANVALT